MLIRQIYRRTIFKKAWNVLIKSVKLFVCISLALVDIQKLFEVYYITDVERCGKLV